MIEAEGKDVGVKVVAFVEIGSGAGGGTALVVLRGLLVGDFRRGFIRMVNEGGFCG